MYVATNKVYKTYVRKRILIKQKYFRQKQRKIQRLKQWA